MIEEADIKNFRGYANVKLTACKRINLIVGENGSGKTSLLEALFLGGGGSVEIALRLRTLRGYEGTVSIPQHQIEEALWRDLFHRFDKKTPVSIAIRGSEYRNRALTIRFNDQSLTVHQLSKRAKADADVEFAPITFDWIGPKGLRSVVKPTLKDGKFQLPSPANLPVESYFFSSTHPYSSSESAGRFSDLSKLYKADDVSEKIKEHFPAIKSLSLELVAGAPMVCAEIPGMPEKVPLNLVSSGMTKLTAILFAIASKKGGLVLIDEIENGIYYKRFPIMWKSLLDFCRTTDTQIFVSSHSGECIKAAADLAATFPDDFGVIQLMPNGKLRQFAGQRFSDAISDNVEIR